jgi:hypothetical protein
MTTRDTDETEFVWNGVFDPTQYSAGALAARHQLADAAKAGDWPLVLRLLAERGTPLTANDWRPGGTAWFTPLHQAAWHGAPASVAEELVARGALRSLTDSRGRTALDIRTQRNSAEFAAKGAAADSHMALRAVLAPPASPLSPTRIRALDAHLTGVIDSRVSGVLYEGRDPQAVLRYPPVAVMHETPMRRMWFPVPGMYGGFDIRLRDGYLEVASWCRVVGGSGQRHVITEEGTTLVEEGFV